MKIRIAFSTFLNSVPLGWSFLNGPLKERFEVISSLPSGCADQLANGEVDIGLIPSIEYQRIPNLQIIPDMAVASVSSVRSVLIVQSREARQVRSVALDTSSRTSVVLAKLLLESKMGLKPTYVSQSPDLGNMLERCDAAVIIGDSALKVSTRDYRITDLAEAWISWQEKPFVFALWACRANAPLPSDLAAIFGQAKEYGLLSRPQIAATYSRILGLPEDFLLGYLSENVDYELGPRHIEGLERFFTLARGHDLIPDLRPVRFLNAGAQAEIAPASRS